MARGGFITIFTGSGSAAGIVAVCQPFPLLRPTLDVARTGDGETPHEICGRQPVHLKITAQVHSAIGLSLPVHGKRPPPPTTLKIRGPDRAARPTERLQQVPTRRRASCRARKTAGHQRTHNMPPLVGEQVAASTKGSNEGIAKFNACEHGKAGCSDWVSLHTAWGDTAPDTPCMGAGQARVTGR